MVGTGFMRLHWLAQLAPFGPSVNGRSLGEKMQETKELKAELNRSSSQTLCLFEEALSGLATRGRYYMLSGDCPNQKATT